MTEWLDCPEMPGFVYSLETFDLGSQYAIAIRAADDKRVRNAFRATTREPDEVYAELLPEMRQWVDQVNALAVQRDKL